MHWHAAARCLAWQTAFWPQGLGLQGSTISVGARAETVGEHSCKYIYIIPSRKKGIFKICVRYFWYSYIIF
jgi:hypothetical protein